MEQLVKRLEIPTSSRHEDAEEGEDCAGEGDAEMEGVGMVRDGGGKRPLAAASRLIDDDAKLEQLEVADPAGDDTGDGRV